MVLRLFWDHLHFLEVISHLCCVSGHNNLIDFSKLGFDKSIKWRVTEEDTGV